MTRIVLILIAVLIIAAAYLGAARAQSSEYVEIDGVVNIMSTTGPGGGPVVTTQQALDAIAEANKIYKQAGIKVNVRKVNSNPSSAPVAAGNADGDASLTEEEDIAAGNAGGRELDTVVGRQKGMKFTFTSMPDVTDSTVVATGRHHRRTVMVGSGGASSQETGQAVAHEMGHALTLSTQMVVATSPAVTTSDAHGHVFEDPNNLMHPYASTAATQLTTSQRDEVRKKAKKWGRTVTKFSESSPAFSQAHGHGGVQDLRGDALGGVLRADIDTMHAYRCCDEALLELALSTAAPFASGPPSATRFYWLFDADGNPLTGVPVAGVQGIETGVEVTIFWAGGGQPTSQVVFRNYVGGPIHSLPPALIINEFRDDVNPPDMPEPRVVVMPNYSELGIAGPQASMTLVAEDVSGGGQLVDRADAIFEVNYESAQPQFSINPPLAMVGQVIQFHGTSFCTNRLVRLFLDDQMIQDQQFTQLDGSINGTFVLPSLPTNSPRHYYFVTLMEDNGRSAFSVLNVMATPCMAGDVNRDGVVNAGDASPLVSALLAPQNDPEIICAADVNHDGGINGRDIQAFVAELP